MRQQQSMSRPAMYMRVLWTGTLVLFLVLITLVGYLQNIRLLSFLGFAVTIYGIITTFHVSMQMVFALLNRGKIRRLIERTRQNGFSPTVSLMSVGYQEDLTLLRNHFLSIKAIESPLNGYIFMSDGNEKTADRAMAEVFREVFPQGGILDLPFVLFEANAAQKAWLYQIVVQRNASQLCILQPHRDKRHAMYTAMRLICDVTNSTAVVTTDSDTVLNKDTVQQLAFPLVDLQVGAVTGDVKILNAVNWLSTLSCVRYWFAFNLERAAQSFWGVVNCVSGPLGAYRTEVLKEILDAWIQQTFLGIRCTYGDDRHLTNLTLKNGWRVLYTPFASCQTETPTSVRRWVRQQIRWNRSFYREMILNFQWAYKHPLWLTYDMTYQTIFPSLLVIGIVLQITFTIHSRSLLPTLTFIASILVGGTFRSLYGYMLTRDAKKFLLAFYGFLYIVFLLPARIWALLTLWNTGWGTSARGAQTQTTQQNSVPAYQITKAESVVELVS